TARNWAGATPADPGFFLCFGCAPVLTYRCTLRSFARRKPSARTQSAKAAWSRSRGARKNRALRAGVRLSASERCVDGLRDCREIGRVWDALAVEEQRGSSLHGHVVAHRQVTLDPLGVGVVVQGGLELGQVEAGSLRVAFQGAAIERV